MLLKKETKVGERRKCRRTHLEVADRDDVSSQKIMTIPIPVRRLMLAESQTNEELLTFEVAFKFTPGQTCCAHGSNISKAVFQALRRHVESTLQLYVNSGLHDFTTVREVAVGAKDGNRKCFKAATLHHWLLG